MGTKPKLADAFFEFLELPLGEEVRPCPQLNPCPRVVDKLGNDRRAAQALQCSHPRCPVQEEKLSMFQWCCNRRIAEQPALNELGTEPFHTLGSYLFVEEHFFECKDLQSGKLRMHAALRFMSGGC
jgi:hypothetical protein